MGDETTPAKKTAAKRGPRLPAGSEVRPAPERLRSVHALIVPAADGGILNIEVFTGESAARRELDNRIDVGWRYLALVPGAPWKPFVVTPL